MMKVIPFLRYRYLTFILSFIAIITGFALTWVRGGFNLGLDFQAGVRLQVQIDTSVKAPIDVVRSAFRGMENPQIQSIGNPANQEYVIKVKQVGGSKTFSTEVEGQVRTALGQQFGEGKVQVLQTEYVGPRFSADLATQTLFLTLFALLLILLYAWFRFKLAYALAAIAATIHDPLLMIGFIGATQLEVSTSTVAAVLTIIGYSINDTIVVFDRIRENVRLMRGTPFPLIIDTSITQSLSRTVITSLTTLVAILAVYIFGSGDVQNFAQNVIIGILIGTYSSIFIAAPTLLEVKSLGERWRQKREAGKTPNKKEAKPGISTHGKVSTDGKVPTERKEPLVTTEPVRVEGTETPQKDAPKPSTPTEEAVQEGEVISQTPLGHTPVAAGTKLAFTPRLSREKRKRKKK